jgi:iron complex outermembrane receptor protein
MRAVFRRSATALLLTSTALAGVALSGTSALAQDAPPATEEAQPAPDTSGYGDIVVTAQKRSESLQSVPISITALGEQKLKDLRVTSFRDYAAQLPSVTFQPSANAGGNPGVQVIYMRGVAAGGEGNHSGVLPAVGVYLDEQPVTTVGGNLDVHIYDIARIESLAGPQGTLYGASSEAGTIRIITNKPELGVWKGSVDGEVNTVHSGGVGGNINGMINAPIASNVALRVVGWYQRDAGYIDNVAGSRTFCGSKTLDADGNVNGCVKDGITVNNDAYVKKNYNTAQVYGERAALKVELDDNWTITPQVMGQKTTSKGFFSYDPSLGDLKVQHFLPEYRSDRFIQAALTIEGKLSNWDVTYAGAYMDRKDTQSSDYTDYAEAYDRLYATVGGIANYFYFSDANGNGISSQQQVIGTDHFTKMSHELRVASPSSEPVRLVAGIFYQRQTNEIHQDYKVAGLAPSLSVNGLPGTLWLTQQYRVDKDYAMFGEASWDIVPTVTLTAGVRGYMYDNSLVGFFGFGRDPAFVQGADNAGPPNAAYSTQTGVAGCFTDTGERLRAAQLAGTDHPTLLPPVIAGSPCTNLGVYAAGQGVQPVKASGDGVTYKFNATWKPQPGLLLYGTVSKGFRPGGINRRNDVAAYQPDTLQNYELGWKTTWLGGLLRINGAIYQQDWKHFQYAFLGANSFTEIHNGPSARIRGAELDAAINAGPLNFSISGAYTDAKTRQNLCLFDDPSLTCQPDDTNPTNMVSAPKGTRLPITPKWKLAGTARYTVPVGAASIYGQVNATYQSSAASDIRQAVYETFTGAIISPADQIGRLPGFATVNLALGSHWDRFRVEGFVSNVFDKRGQLARLIECGSCGQRPYIVPTTPRTIGLRVGADF